MKFGRQAAGRQTCMSLADRDRLVFDYTRMMMAALYLNPSPQRVLIIGLGGGTLPGALQKILPAARIDAVEIDPAVVRVAGKYFGFVPGRQTRCSRRTGACSSSACRSSRSGTIWCCSTRSTTSTFPSICSPANSCSKSGASWRRAGCWPRTRLRSSRLYHFESATYFSAFGDFYRLKSSNRVILVRLGGLPDRDELARNAGDPGSQARAASGWAGNGCCRHRRWSPAGRRAPRAHRPILAVESAERIQLTLPAPTQTMITKLFSRSALHEHPDPAQRVQGVAALPPDSGELAQLVAADPAPEVRAGRRESMHRPSGARRRVGSRIGSGRPGCARGCARQRAFGHDGRRGRRGVARGRPLHRCDPRRCGAPRARRRTAPRRAWRAFAMRTGWSSWRSAPSAPSCAWTRRSACTRRTACASSPARRRTRTAA